MALTYCPSWGIWYAVSMVPRPDETAADISSRALLVCLASASNAVLISYLKMHRKKEGIQNATWLMYWVNLYPIQLCCYLWILMWKNIRYTQLTKPSTVAGLVVDYPCWLGTPSQCPIHQIHTSSEKQLQNWWKSGGWQHWLPWQKT